MRNIEQPVTQKGDGSLSEDVTTHPAFAQIGASRVSGQANLYGSDFSHQNYICISINKSQLHRSLSRDWEFARGEMIQVALSEAQWATFVSSLNVGSGVPCTLQTFAGKSIPQLPKPDPLTNKFNEELLKTMASIQDDLENLASSVDGMGLGKSKAADLKRTLDLIKSRMTNSTGFVAKQFEKHVEDVIEGAKSEVNAYVMTQVARAGLEASKAPISLLGHIEDSSTL